MSKTIYQLVDELPSQSMTTRVLGALDWVVPGEWQNVVGFENTIKHVTGEKDQARIQKIGERTIALYNDKSQGYQRAVWLYQTVDSVQGLGGFASFVNKIGESVGFLSFLQKITPQADTTQAVDFGVKLVTEIVAFCKINGIPGDRITDLHVWQVGPGHHAAIVAVLTPQPRDTAFYKQRLARLDELSHVTVEVTRAA